MKKIKDNDFRLALDAIAENKILFNEKGQLIKEYDGYIASMGASIINSGLLPTLSFYTDIHNKNDKKPKEARRYKLLKTLFKVVDNDRANNLDKGLLEYTLSEVYEDYNSTASVGNLGQKNEQKLRTLKNRVLESAVAVKLAMRNFEHSDSSKS